MHKGQGQKPQLDARDHGVLRQICKRNSHPTMVNTATWVHFHSTQSAAASKSVCYYTRRSKISTLNRNAMSSLGSLGEGLAHSLYSNSSQRCSIGLRSGLCKPGRSIYIHICSLITTMLHAHYMRRKRDFVSGLHEKQQ